MGINHYLLFSVILRQVCSDFPHLGIPGVIADTPQYMILTTKVNNVKTEPYTVLVRLKYSRVDPLFLGVIGIFLY